MHEMLEPADGANQEVMTSDLLVPTCKAVRGRVYEASWMALPNS